MKGLVLAGPRRIEYRTDLPDPELLDPGDALVAVRLAGVCGSDLHPYEGREAVLPGMVPGHEAAGEVLEVGPGVEGFRSGDRVSLPFTTSCGRCTPCRSGLSARCLEGRLFGWAPPGGTPADGLQGTQAEVVRVPLADGTLIRLSPDDSFAAGLLLGDNFATGFFCARSAEVRPGARVAVVGCGAVGLSALVVARWLGASFVLALDPVARRRDAALRLGADRAADPGGDGGATSEATFDATYDATFDAVLEAVGSPSARRLALALAAPAATIASVGVATGEFGFPPGALYDRNLTWRSGRCPVRSLQDPIRRAVAEGLEIPVSELAPGPPAPLSDGPDVYARFASRSGDVGKPLLAP